MRQGSLRRRLLAVGAASVVLALALAGLGLLLLFERHVERRMAVELEAHLRQLAAGLERTADGGVQLAQEPAEPRFDEPLGGLYWQVVVEPGGPVLRSRSLWDAALELPPDELADGELHRHTIAGPGPGPGRASLLVVERTVVLPGSLGGGQARIADHRICEYPAAPKPLAVEITGNHLHRGANGEVAAPDAPGLGIVVDEEAVGRYLRTVEIRIDDATLLESRLPNSRPGS